MLAGACVELARRGDSVSVIARGHARLSDLRQRAQAVTGRTDAITPLPLDYSEVGLLAAGLRTATMARGPFDRILCYAHTSAPMAPIVAADMAASSGHRCTYVHIVGSDEPQELAIDTTRDEIAAMPGLAYRRVILGFVREASGSRWLTDDEICRGVLKAVDDPTPEQVVGTLTPWELRPR